MQLSLPPFRHQLRDLSSQAYSGFNGLRVQVRLRCVARCCNPSPIPSKQQYCLRSTNTENLTLKRNSERRHHPSPKLEYKGSCYLSELSGYFLPRMDLLNWVSNCSRVPVWRVSFFQLRVLGSLRAGERDCL